MSLAARLGALVSKQLVFSLTDVIAMLRVSCPSVILFKSPPPPSVILFRAVRLSIDIGSISVCVHCRHHYVSV